MSERFVTISQAQRNLRSVGRADKRFSVVYILIYTITKLGRYGMSLPLVTTYEDDVDERMTLRAQTGRNL